MAFGAGEAGGADLHREGGGWIETEPRGPRIESPQFDLRAVLVRLPAIECRRIEFPATGHEKEVAWIRY